MGAGELSIEERILLTRTYRWWIYIYICPWMRIAWSNCSASARSDGNVTCQNLHVATISVHLEMPPPNEGTASSPCPARSRPWAYSGECPRCRPDSSQWQWTCAACCQKEADHRGSLRRRCWRRGAAASSARGGGTRPGGWRCWSARTSGRGSLCSAGS
jgi:hypothetical protein